MIGGQQPHLGMGHLLHKLRVIMEMKPFYRIRMAAIDSEVGITTDAARMRLLRAKRKLSWSFRVRCAARRKKGTESGFVPVESAPLTEWMA